VSDVPERDAADRAFKAAHAHADEIETGRDDAANLGSAVAAVVYALEGVMRQIRDHDDTQFNVHRELRETLNDSNVTTTSAITDALDVIAGRKR
jgi:hypothetical protein